MIHLNAPNTPAALDPLFFLELLIPSSKRSKIIIFPRSGALPNRYSSSNIAEKANNFGTTNRSSSSRCWRSIKAVSHPGQGSRDTEVLAHARHLDGLPQCSTSASAIARSPAGLDHARQQGCSPCRRRSWRRRRRSLEGPPCPWRPEVPAVSWVAVTESKWS